MFRKASRISKGGIMEEEIKVDKMSIEELKVIGFDYYNRIRLLSAELQQLRNGVDLIQSEIANKQKVKDVES